MAATNSAYDPTIIAIEIIQSLQSQGAGEAQTAPVDPSNSQPSSQNAVSPDAAQINATSQNASTAGTQTQSAPVATISPQISPESNSPLNDIGPFGWVGIGFLFCLLFALILNIYLKKQKKEMEARPSKEELEKFAPGPMEG